MNADTPRRTFFFASIATGVFALLAACSTDGEKAPSRPVPFEETFTVASKVLLKAAHDDPIGEVTSALLWNDNITVMDSYQGNVKIFDPQGNLLKTLGRAGHGPGEFLSPFAGAVLQDGSLAVLDSPRMFMSLFGRDGDFRKGWFVPGIMPGGVAAEERGRLIVFARLVADQKIASDYGAHVFTVDGRRLRSFRKDPPPVNRFQDGFTTLAGTLVGRVVVSTNWHHNVVHHHDLRTGQEHSDTIGSAIYRAPDWPTRRFPSPEEATRWGAQQMWTSKIIALDSLRYAVRFTSYDLSTKRPIYRYAIARTDGRTLAVTGPTGINLQAAMPGQVLATEEDDEGNVYATILRLNERPVSAPDPR
jgi:hypothetical protein